MAAGGEGDILAALKEIAVGLHHGAGGGVEGLEESVVEFDRGIGVVGAWETRRGARDADGRLKIRRGETVRV